MAFYNLKARLVASAGNGRYEILAVAVGPWHESKKGPTGKPIYSTEASLQASVSMFDGVPVAAYELKPGFHDHLPESVFAAIEENGIAFLKNKIGRLYSPRFGKTESGEQGIIVGFEVTDPNIAETVQASLSLDRPDFDGFSVDGSATWAVEMIDGVAYDVPTITTLKTLDMVKYPAAGGKVLRLAASQNLEGLKMNLTAKQRATIIAVLVAAGVGDEILNNLIACAPDAFINKGRELLAKEREFLKKFDDTLAKFERGEEVKIEEKGTGEPVPDAKAKADAEAKKAAEDAAKLKSDQEAKAKAEAEAKAEVKPEVADDPAVKKAQELLDKAQKMADQATVAMGEAAIESTVTASHLPDVTKKALTDRLKASRTYDKKEIGKAIDAEAQYLKIILGDKIIPGLRITGSVEQMQNETDLLILGMRGMLTGKDQKDAKGNLVPAFRSWREANYRITGSRYEEPLDRVFRKLQKLSGGIGTEANELVDLNTGRLTASFTTSDLASVFLVAMHNQFITDYKEPSQYDVWRKVAKIVSLQDLYAHAFTRAGWYAAAPAISEGGTYDEISTAPTDENISLTAVKYGHILAISDVMVINDRLGELQRLQRSLSDGMKRDIHNDVMAIITGNAAVAYGSDTDTLVHTNHSNGAASGGVSMAAVDTDNLAAAWAAMYNQTEFGSSMKLGDLNKPRYLLVHPTYILKALALTLGERAIQTATTSGEYPANSALPDAGILNAIAQSGYAMETIPLLNTTTTTDWWTVADPNTTPAPAVMVGFLNGMEQPEVVSEAANTGSNFTADKIRIKVKNWRDAEPGDHRGIYGQLA